MFDILETRNILEQNRQQLKFKVLLNKKSTKKPLQLHDRDAQENFFVLGEKFTKEPNKFIAEKKFHSMGFQAIQGKKESSTNTDYLITFNKVIQTEQNFISQNQDQKNEQKLVSFLKEVFLRFEESLIENEIINIYKNDLIIKDSENQNKEDGTELSIIKELKSFEYENSQRQNVTQIEFEPSLNLLAISLIQNFSFEERIDISGSSYESNILLWNYEDFHRFIPIGILESPSEFTCFQFKPDNPLFIIAGTMNGQVHLYDIRSIFENQSNDNKEGQKEQKDISFHKSSISSSPIESFNANLNLIQKETFSKKQIHLTSHRTSVVSINFLPKNILLDKKNPFNIIKKQKDEENDFLREQFVSLSSDGNLLFWSLDFNDPKEKNKILFENFKFKNIVWKSFFSIQLFQDDLKPLQTTNLLIPLSNKNTLIYCTNNISELYKLDYNLEQQLNSEQKLEIIKQRKKINSEQAVLSMDISPFIHDLILIVSDSCFFLFGDDFDYPLFVSPFLQNSKLTCGKFSATRSSVLFIGRQDGIIDIWDFVEQTGLPSQQHQVSAAGIDYIQVNKIKINLIAVGDINSCIHLLNIPKSLNKYDSQEEKIMKEFLLKEKNKNSFFNQKYQEILDKQLEQKNNNQENKFDKDIHEYKDTEKNKLEIEIVNEYEQFLENHFKSQEQEQNDDQKQIQFIIQDQKYFQDLKKIIKLKLFFFQVSNQKTIQYQVSNQKQIFPLNELSKMTF